MKQAEHTQLMEALAALDGAFDVEALVYDQTRVMAAHRLLRALAATAKVRESKAPQE